MSRGMRKAMISRDHPGLSLSQQCGLLSISRSSFYYTPTGECEETLTLMRRIDELFLKYPFYGSRQMVRQLQREDICVGRHRVRRLMRLTGLEAIHQAPRTSDPHPRHRISISAEEHGDRPAQSGLVCGHNLHTCSAWVPVSRCSHGLGDTSRPRMATVEHHG